MTSEQAKEILRLYRPGTADAEEPAFAESLDLVQRDPELKHWFDTHCELYAAIRAKFKQTPVPEGLKEQILAERQVHLPAFWQRRSVVAAVAACALLMIAATIWLQPREDTTFSGYANRMVGDVRRMYKMDLETNDLTQIQTYLAEHAAPGGYVVPKGLAKATPTACAVRTWQGQKVALLCFKSERQLPADTKSDLFLFVTDKTSIQEAPVAMKIDQVKKLTTIAWTQGDKVYILAGAGDEEFVRKYL